MPVFYHVDFRGEIRLGDTLTTLPVTSAEFPEDARELNKMFPEGLSYFGAAMLLRSDYDAAESKVEQLLETIRREFKEKCGVDYPGRLTSLFATADLESAILFRDGYKRETSRIWQVECKEAFRGDMNFIGKELLDNHDLAVHYWQGRAKSETPFWEFLLRPPIHVVRLIEANV